MITNMNKQKVILVIEDEKIFQKLLTEALELEGFIVLSADNGKVGLEMALKHHPDAILLDIVMPVMGGLEMLEILRKDQWGKKALVIALTNLSEPKNKDSIKENKIHSYLVKSDWKLQELVKKLKKEL